jgi:hypothetical protein
MKTWWHRKQLNQLGDWAVSAFDAILCTIVVLAFILFAMSKIVDLFFLNR